MSIIANKASTVTMDKLVEAYVTRRDQLSAIEREYKEKKAPIQGEMEKLETAMQRLMDEMEMSSVRTAHGTAYKQTWTSAKVSDWEATLDYIRERERYDLLERRVNKTAVLDTEEPIPGVEVQQGVKVNVRKS